MRVRARPESGRDCAEKSVAPLLRSGTLGADCAWPDEVAAKPMMAAAPVAKMLTVIVRVISCSSR